MRIRAFIFMFALSLVGIGFGMGRTEADGSLSPFSSIVQAPMSASISSKPHVSLRAQPLAFEVNRGQCPAPIGYVCRGQDYTFYFSPREAVLFMHKVPTPAAGTPAPAAGTPAPAVIRIAVAGAARAARPEGISPLRAKVSYFLGRDPKGWLTSISTFARLRYAGVYPGIDLVYYGRPGQLEYDFVLAPQASVGDIALRFSGTGRPTVARDGSLVMALSGGEVRWHRPLLYQNIGSRRTLIPGAYRLLAGGQVGFRAGSYDKSRPLTIDPTLTYSTYIGGSGLDSGSAVQGDSAGNVYVAGETSSADFPTTPGAGQRSLPLSVDGNGHPLPHAFVLKFSPLGELVYSTYLGGNNFESANGIAVDKAGDAYVTGETGSTDFPTTSGSLLPDAPRYTGAAYLAILSPDGTRLQYSTYLRGSSFVIPLCLAVDGNGVAYIAGLTNSEDILTTAGAFQAGFRGDVAHDRDAFFLKIDPHLVGAAALVYGTCLGTDGYSLINGLAIDTSGAAYLTGSTSSPRFPTTPDAFQQEYLVTGGTRLNHIPYENAFVAKIDPAQSGAASLAYSTFLGTADGVGQAIAGDSSGNIYVAGAAMGGLPATPGAYQENYRGTDRGEEIRGDAFVAKMDLRRAGPASLLYLTYLGGQAGERASAIAIDSQGRAYIAGTTRSTDFPVTPEAAQKVTPEAAQSAGLPDSGFVSVLSAEGSRLLYSTYLGGSDTTNIGGLALSTQGALYVTGLTSARDFPVTRTAIQRTLGGSGFVFNAFLTVFAFGPGQ